jgi:hypothetical protein
MRHQFTGAQLAINILDRSAALCDSADELHPRAKLNALAEVAVKRIDEAVTEAVAKPTTPLSKGGYEQHSQVKYSNTRTAEENAVALAGLVSSLSAVVTQVDSLRNVASNSGYRSNKTKNVPAQVLAEAADQLDRLIAEVTGSAGDDSDTALHVSNCWRLSAVIAQIADKLRVAQNPATSWEERAIQRFLTEADKVPTDVSPAHLHIAECWLQAATHMRLAVEAQTAACTGGNADRIRKHRFCAKAYETLATITFGDAGIYFVKAANPRAILQARELWREAAELSVEIGRKQMRKTEEAVGMDAYTATALHKPSTAEIAVTNRVAACAACATAVDALSVNEVDATTSLLTEGAPVSASSLTAVQDGTTTGFSYAVLAQTMRLLLVHIERVRLVKTAHSDSWDLNRGPHDTVRHHLRGAATDILLLYQSAQVEVPTFPEGHLLYSPATPAVGVQQRDRMLRGLCCAVAGCYAHYKLAVESWFQLVSEVLLRSERNFDRLALESLKMAVNLLQCIIRYACEPFERHGYVYSEDPYVTVSPAHAQWQLVLCLRHLAACRLALAKNALAHALMELTALPKGSDEVPVPLPGVVSNALVKRAWQLHAADDGVPPNLLFSAPREDTKEGSAARQQAVLAALEQICLQQLALSSGVVVSAQEITLRNAAIKHYSKVVAVGVSIFRDTGAHIALIQRQNESFTRASRSAVWSELAVDACVTGKLDVAELYQRAAQLAITVETSTNDVQRKMGPDDAAAQQLGDKAGMRFAEAALALAAGNLSLYKRWLQAAEATAKLVQLTTPRDGSSAKPKLTLSEAHRAWAVRDADDLEAEAVVAAGAL